MALTLWTLLFAGLFVGLTASASFAGDSYTIEINGNAYDIGLDQKTQLVLPDGARLELLLSRKELLVFSGELFAFSHRNTHEPARTDLGGGVYQTMITTPLGSGIIVQEYTSMDPSTLVDFMARELTKEEIEFGYDYHEKGVEKTIGSITLKGKEIVTTHKGDQWTRTVFAAGKRDAGIVIITFIEQDAVQTDQQLIDRLWDTLKIKL